jgi:hypothetical protein
MSTVVPTITTTTNTTLVPTPVPMVTTVSPLPPQVKEVGPACDRSAAPWPVIIVAIVGGVLVIYTAVAPGVSTDRRAFGAILLGLWTLAWALILWVIWRECHHPAAWWLLLVPIALMTLFFVLIIILDLGE